MTCTFMVRRKTHRSKSTFITMQMEFKVGRVYYMRQSPCGWLVGWSLSKTLSTGLLSWFRRLTWNFLPIINITYSVFFSTCFLWAGFGILLEFLTLWDTQALMSIFWVSVIFSNQSARKGSEKSVSGAPEYSILDRYNYGIDVYIYMCAGIVQSIKQRCTAKLLVDRLIYTIIP